MLLKKYFHGRSIRMFKKVIGPAMVTMVLVVALFATPYEWAGGRAGAVSNDDYEKLRLFTDIINIVKDNYTEEVETEELVHGAVRGMLRSLDPHSSFMTAEEYAEMQVDTRGSFGGLGIEIGLRDGMLTIISPIEDTPAFKAGLQAKDKIVKIEDQSTRDMTLSEAVKLMRGPRGTPVTIWIMRDGFDEPKAFKITRAIIKLKSVKFRLLEEGFGYVRLAQFQESTTKDLEKALKELGSREGKLKGLVLDLRNNPGGLLQQAISVSDVFLSKGVIVSTKGRSAGQDMEFLATGEGTHPDYPIIILVNGGSASASEIVAGALQDHKRAVILGVATFGKGSVQTIIQLSDGAAVKLTTSKYYTPSGKSIQARGIEPDIVVGKEVRGHIKEKDLAGHLVVENGDEVEKGDKATKVKVKEGAASVDGEDVQLKRALDYLKSWHIFESTRNRAG